MAAAVDSPPDLSNAPSDEDEFASNGPTAEDEEGSALVNAGEDDDDLGDDLFGDDDDDDDADQPQHRKLDDEELDSGDDEGRTDRARVTPEIQDQNFNFMEADIARHAVPEPSDGELYLFKVPVFMSVEPTAFDHRTFQPPTTDHHSKLPPSDHFSAFNTAMTTIRWRHSPSDHSKLQSNARILRWSDGSLTLQHANDPANQYEINAGMLAPPQINPKLPTPTMVKGRRKDDQKKESYTYLMAPCQEANVMRVTNKFTTFLSVVATSNTKDSALEKLQNDLAVAAARGRDSADQAISFIDVNEDPELRRQREELNYKEKLKQQRAREKHALREQERNSRVMNKSSRGGYGLDADMLEGGEGRRKGGARKPRAQARRGHDDWSDDDDEAYARRGANKEDDYDDEDDFIARSDEEPEVVSDDEDVDDGIIEEPRSRKARDTQSPKRGRSDEDEDEDEDVIVRSKKRRVVVDEDEDDE
ncbi:Paf1 complex component [Kalmusia sp. IMI 367209]|nr:Paf1 complex component [Kalmusia sp. IMI 367209]